MVGLGSGIYTHFDFAHPQHTLVEVTDQGHDREGEWYYGLDISVHPEYRGKGIGRKLYDARKALVQRDNKRGIVAGGLTPDFTKHKDSMSIEDYVDKICQGNLYDSTLSFQLRRRFCVQSDTRRHLAEMLPQSKEIQSGTGLPHSKDPTLIL